jgi:hypothetical protein
MSTRPFRPRSNKSNKKVFLANKNQRFVTKQQVKQMLRTEEEIKYSSVSQNTTVPNTIVVTDITSIAQGAAGTQRIGDAIRVKHIQLKGYIVPATATTILRLLIVQWLVDTSTDALTSLAEVFVDQSQPTSSTLLPSLPKKFKLLMDKTVMSSNTTDSVVKFDWQTNCNIKVGYLAGGNTGINHIYLLQIADEPSSVPTIVSTMTVQFSDE